MSEHPKPKWWLAFIPFSGYEKKLALHEGRVLMHVSTDGRFSVDRETLHNSQAYKDQVAALDRLVKNKIGKDPE